MTTLNRKLVAECVGTAMLLCAVVGSGIMGDRLSGGSVGLALLANSIATGAALVAIILAFGPISGAHLNPVVTVADATQEGIPWAMVLPYVAAQCAGAVLGVVTAHVMFGEPPVTWSVTARDGSGQVIGEFVATFGLLSVIWGTVRSRPTVVPFAVGAYIAAAYWFTSSTSFANPAVTIARTMSNTFAGIRAADAFPFIAAQIAGASAATLLFRWLVPALPRMADHVVVPHDTGGTR